MANSKALTPFSGRCRVHQLPAAAAHAADTARMLRLMQPPRPTLPTGITARTGDGALVLLLALLLALAGCKVASTTRERETAVPTKSFTTRVPAGPYDWSNED